ncbi:MAG: hypothetical protein ACYDH0_13015 [Candidatus Aminicenantales bacterium]
MYERKSDPLLPFGRFVLRLLGHFLVALGLISVSLGIGIAGYHFLESLSWIDALLNASMILGGMGPVDPIRTPAGKLFASFYSLFSGVVFLAIVGIIMAPVGHRLLHNLHLERADQGRKA